LQYVVVPEPQNLPAFLTQERIAPVVIARLGMLSAIGFDNQAGFWTGKIDDVRCDDELTAETKPQLPIAQDLPKGTLRICRIATEFPRALADVLSAAQISFRISRHSGVWGF